MGFLFVPVARLILQVVVVGVGGAVVAYIGGKVVEEVGKGQRFKMALNAQSALNAHGAIQNRNGLATLPIVVS